MSGIVVRKLGDDDPLYAIQDMESWLPGIYLTEGQARELVELLAEHGITEGGER